MGIQKYVFYSIDKCEKYRDVPLMNMKYAVEEYLKSEWDELCRVETVRVYAAIGGRARPCGAGGAISVGYRRRHENGVLDTQDVAQMTMAAVRREEANGKVLTLAGPKAYTVNQVIQLRKVNEAKVSKVPVLLLKFTRGLTRFFQWTSAASDRLAFAEVLSSGVEFNSDKMAETYEILGMDEKRKRQLWSNTWRNTSQDFEKVERSWRESRQRFFICKSSHQSFAPFYV